MSSQECRRSNANTQACPWLLEKWNAANLSRSVVATDPAATRWHFVCDNLNIHQSEALVRLGCPAEWHRSGFGDQLLRLFGRPVTKRSHISSR